MTRPIGIIIPRSEIQKSKIVIEQVIPKLVNDSNNIRMIEKLNLVLSLIKKKRRTLMDLVVETGYSQRSIMYYIDLLRRRKLVKMDECPCCKSLNKFYVYRK